ncbi:MAG: TolC family protein [Sedimentisphaerales bacterium]|nr:TolC family protein [Sedimentisphaerales bacterium]
MRNFVSIIVIIAGVCCLCGCSPQKYKKEADTQVQKIFDKKWQAEFGPKANYTIADVNGSSGDIHITQPIPASGIMPLNHAVAVATVANRDYQTQKETLYEKALSLTLARHAFDPQFFGNLSGTYENDAGDESVSSKNQFGFNQLLSTGAQVSTSVALDAGRFLGSNSQNSLGSILSASVTQPLLRGSGAYLAKETLTQADRNVVYQLRDFARFRKTFVVSVVSDYYRVLQALDAVKNAENNYENIKISLEQVEMMAEAGRRAAFQVDQARQDLLRANDNVVREERTYKQLLDSYKIKLAIPTDANMVLDSNELSTLVAAGVREPNYPLDDAVQTALAHRLDLANSHDSVEDANRRVAVAAEALQADLNLVGSANAASTPNTKAAKLQFDKGTYSAGVELDLPFERFAERNAYRQSLINLIQAQRSYEQAIDEVKLDVRDSYRNLQESAALYAIQQRSLELAQSRVESVSMLLQAGRAETRDLLDAQQSLLDAQNGLTSAIVNHAIAKLNFFTNIDILQVRPNGLWELPPQ